MASPNTRLVTKRVTLPIGADGSSANIQGASVGELCVRSMLALPVSTTRWRLRVRNYRAAAHSSNAGAIPITGLWVGSPKWPASGAWDGQCSANLQQWLAGFTMPDGADGTSAWVTDATLQWQRGVTYALSLGINAPVNTPIASAGGYNGLLWGLGGGSIAAGMSAAGVAGGAGYPKDVSSAATPIASSALDVRLEYEFVTPVVGGVPVVLTIGDSITAGSTVDTPNYTVGFPHLSWPGAASVAQGFALVNLGVGGAQTTDFAVALSDWMYSRADLVTTKPDIAVIALGTNDVNLSVANATIEANLQAIIANLRAYGIPRVYLATIIPRNFAGATETARVAVNTWMRQGAAGATGLIDLDKAVAVQAAPATIDPAYVTTYPHLTLGGYQKMASAVPNFRLG